MTGKQPTKTWREMLDNSLENPKFREEWVTANAELDKCIAAGSTAGKNQSGCDNSDAETVEAKQCKSFSSEMAQTFSER